MFDSHKKPTQTDIDEQNEYLLRRRDHFRLAAEEVAAQLSRFDEVDKIMLVGSVAKPLKKEVPRFREYRRAQIEVWHECKDVDLAIWINDLACLGAIRRAIGQTLGRFCGTANIRVAHHQVELFIMQPGTNAYLGNLCLFNTCPKQQKRQCLVDNCGKPKFLQQYFDFHLYDTFLDGGVVLYDHIQR